MPDYRHLRTMTDDQGMLQFCQSACPDVLSGYTLDDNARALMVALSMENGHELALRYAGWMFKAQRANGSWCNLRVQGRDIAALDSEDSVGRALLACSLGCSSTWDDVGSMCRSMLKHHFPRAVSCRSPRAIAYVLTGLCKLEKPLTRQEYQWIQQKSSDLIGLYRRHQRTGWHWFEDIMTYCNGILPQALFCAYLRTGDKKALKTGHDSLNFMCDTLFSSGYLNIIGNQDWFKRGSRLPAFDQQPVDAASTAFACLEAYQTIGGQEYLDLAGVAYQWYHGLNIHQLPLYDPHTGGCYDALTAEGVNLNQGAEAVLSLLLSEQHIAVHFRDLSKPASMEQTS